MPFLLLFLVGEGSLTKIELKKAGKKRQLILSSLLELEDEPRPKTRGGALASRVRSLRWRDRNLDVTSAARKLLACLRWRQSFSVAQFSGTQCFFLIPFSCVSFFFAFPFVSPSFLFFVFPLCFSPPLFCVSSFLLGQFGPACSARALKPSAIFELVHP